MKFEIDCLEELSDDDLKNLSAAISMKIKKSRKAVEIQLKKDSKLMAAWITKLGIDPPKALPDEVVEIRNQRKREFELALSSNPEAFITFQTNSFLVQFGECIRIIRVNKSRNSSAKSSKS